MGATPIPKKKNITAILLEAGLVDEAQIQKGLVCQQQTGRRIGETLVDMGAVSEEDIGWALSRQLELTFVDLHLDALDESLIRDFPESLLRRLQAVPLVRAENELSVALADPTESETIDEMEKQAGLPLGIGVATPTMIRVALDHVFGVRRDQRALHGESLHLVRSRDRSSWERSGTAFLNAHVSEALERGASEIHLVPCGEQVTISYREGMELVEIAREPLEILDSLQVRLEALGGPTFGKGETHARGSAVCLVAGDEVDLDISMVRCAPAIAVTLYPRFRVQSAPSLAELGLTPAQISDIEDMLAQPAGLILVSGPQRSGCSTTLASLVSATETEGKRVLAIAAKDSIAIPGSLRLRMAGEEALTNWEDMVAEQSADIVLLDDTLTGSDVLEVLSTALTRRLALIRTNWFDSFDLVGFLLQVPQARSILSRRLLGILQQRLVRTEVGDTGITGGGRFRGLRGVFEVLFLDDKMRQALRDGEGVARLRTLANNNGFRSLATVCGDLVESGAMDAAEAARILT